MKPEDVAKHKKHYDFALYKSILYMLSKSTVQDQNRDQNLRAIDRYLLSVNQKIIDETKPKPWLLTWARELYSQWARHLPVKATQEGAVSRTRIFGVYSPLRSR